MIVLGVIAKIRRHDIAIWLPGGMIEICPIFWAWKKVSISNFPCSMLSKTFWLGLMLQFPQTVLQRCALYTIVSRKRIYLCWNKTNIYFENTWIFHKPCARVFSSPFSGHVDLIKIRFLLRYLCVTALLQKGMSLKRRVRWLMKKKH